MPTTLPVSHSGFLLPTNRLTTRNWQLFSPVYTSNSRGCPVRQPACLLLSIVSRCICVVSYIVSNSFPQFSCWSPSCGARSSVLSHSCCPESQAFLWHSVTGWYFQRKLNTVKWNVWQLRLTRCWLTWNGICMFVVRLRIKYT